MHIVVGWIAPEKESELVLQKIIINDSRTIQESTEKYIVKQNRKSGIFIWTIVISVSLPNWKRDVIISLPLSMHDARNKTGNADVTLVISISQIFKCS